jgi:hypothetical protein
MIARTRSVVPSLVPGIPVLLEPKKTWMAGTSPAMTKNQNSIFALPPDLMLSAMPCSILRAMNAR